MAKDWEKYHEQSLEEAIKALECVFTWLANSQDFEKCKDNPFPDGIVKEVLKKHGRIT